MGSSFNKPGVSTEQGCRIEAGEWLAQVAGSSMMRTRNGFWWGCTALGVLDKDGEIGTLDPLHIVAIKDLPAAKNVVVKSRLASVARLRARAGSAQFVPPIH